MKRHVKTKKKTIAYGAGKIRITEWGSYQADVSIEGKRSRKQFETRDEAEEFIDQQVGERDRLGESYKKLKAAQVDDASAAYVRLAENGLEGVKLSETANFYIKHHSTQHDGWTVNKVFDEYIDALEHPEEGTPARPRTIYDKRNRLSSFLEIFGEQPVERITETDVDDWLESTEADGRNLRNYKTQIQSLFNYAEENAPGKYINTVARFKQKKAKEVTPASTLTPKQAGAVLKELEIIGGKSVVTMAICLFAGIRSDEVASAAGKEGLQWTDIDLEEKRITVRAALAKTGKKRDVIICDNLVNWLKRYEEDEGKVSWTYDYFREQRAEACERAGVKWGNNLARHSFATYYARLHGKHAAAEQLGHRGNVQIIEDHYLGKAVRKKDAEAYFDIKPKRGGKVIDISKAG
jgi:integrase